MAIGSAFDARIKCHLYKKFKCGDDPQYEIDSMFPAQVEPQCRDMAWKDSEIVFNKYLNSGAYTSLCSELEGSLGPPRFELSIQADISCDELVGPVPILGKPDIMYINREGCRVIHDWKVNGYYSNSPPSPKPGYVSIWPGGDNHKNCFPTYYKGIKVNSLGFTDKEWGEQLSMYAWILGEQIGGDYVLTVDQLVCNKIKNEIRFGKHAGTVDHNFQVNLFKDMHRRWYALKQGHVFTDLDFEQSRAMCKAIDVELSAITNPIFDALSRTR
jgi:hypothetical protein